MDTVNYPTAVVQGWMAERDYLRAENASLRAALEEIAHPVAHIQRLAQGAQVDGPAAIALLNDAGYLRGVAERALSTPPSAAVERVRLMGAVADAARGAQSWFEDQTGSYADYYDSSDRGPVVSALDAALAALEAYGTQRTAPLHERIEALAGEWEEIAQDTSRDGDRRDVYEAVAAELRSALKGEG